MTIAKPCMDCGMPTRLGARCGEHRLANQRKTDSIRRARGPRGYDTARWHRLSSTLIARHLRSVGPWCPGTGERQRHVAADWTVDHIKPLADGGPMWDEANLRVMCRSCNSARRGGWGSPSDGPKPKTVPVGFGSAARVVEPFLGGR